jgi:Flp pilus assembly protein TadD
VNNRGVLFLLGLLIGLGAGFGLPKLMEDPDTVPSSGPGQGGVYPEAAGVTDPAAGGAELAGNADASPGTAEEGAQVTLSEKGVTLLREFDAGSFKTPEALRTGWSLLAQLYALAGRAEDAERMIRAAIETGADVSAVLAAVAHVKGPPGLALFQTLRGEFPEFFDTDPVAVANVLLARGATGEASELARQKINAAEKEPHWRFIEVLIEADLDGKTPFLLDRAKAAGWGPDMLNNIAERLVGKEREDAALLFIFHGLTIDLRHDALMHRLRSIDLEKALVYVNRRLNDDPEDTPAWVHLAEIRKQQGDDEGAFRAYSQALGREVNSEWLGHLLYMDPKRALPLIEERTRTTADDESMGMLAKAYLCNNDDKAALDVFLKAHDRDPSDPEWLEGMLMIDPTRTSQVLAERVGETGDGLDVEIIGAYARSLELLGQTDAAWKWYAKAHEGNTSDVDWALGMIRANPAQALTRIEKDAGDAPSTERKILLAAARGANGDVGGGRALMEQVVESEAGPDSWKAWAAFDAPTALERVTEKLDKNPKNGGLWMGLAFVHMGQGNKAEARRALAKALEIEPQNWQYRMEEARLSR